GGLVVDRLNGNVFKPDRYGFPGRARHGLAPMERARVSELYQRERQHLSSRQYAWIDSLFALPEAVIFTSLVDYFDRAVGTPKPDYALMWDHIREGIDLAHRDGSIKETVRARLGDFIETDPHLAEALHKLRSSGKRLFLLTNSAWDYTDPVMRHLLDGQLAAYPSWKSYFDIIVVAACKPEFFTEERPFVDLDGEGLPLVRTSSGPFARGRVYSGGNLKQFEARARASGDSCKSTSECDAVAGFACVIKGADTEGTCQKPRVVQPGLACDALPETCTDGFYCNGDNCIAGKDTGSECATQQECGSEGYCAADGTFA
ncbi:MAG: 5'-nucleotidase domain-containing protein, partial [Bacteroidota bacterium]